MREVRVEGFNGGIFQQKGMGRVNDGREAERLEEGVDMFCVCLSQLQAV